MDNNRLSGMILIDYCEALDMVDHVILQDKLYAYGLDNRSLTWSQSYLCDRCQFVSMSDKESTTSIIPHGVPQGSILGPLLFVLFINDLPLHVSSANTDLYADDTSLTCSFNWMDMDRLQTSLNAAVSGTVHWATANKLPLNEKKTKVLTICGKRLSNRIPNDIIISVNGSQLENIQCAKLLGLEIDKELIFHSHVDKFCKELSQRIGILKKIRHCLQIKHRVPFYNAIIRPVMDYVSVIWSNCDKHRLDRVLKLQKSRAAKIVTGADSYAPSVQLFNMFKWIPFFENAKLAKCCIIYKRLQGRVPIYLTNLLALTSETYSRQTRYAKFNINKFLVSKETVVLRRWERSKQKFGFIKRVDEGEITTVKDLES